MGDFTFLYPLWFLALLPLIGLLYLPKTRQKSSGLFAPHLAQHFGVKSKNSQKLGGIFFAIIWLLAVIALSGPSWQKQEQPVYSNKEARVVVLSLSQSMMAKDIAPNRLQQAKFKILDLLPEWKEGVTGLVAYAGEGYMISPMTADTSTLENLIPQLTPSLIPSKGERTSEGVVEAIKLLQQAGYPQGDIVIVADNINRNEQQKISQLLSGTEYHLTILAVSTTEGAPIPDQNGQLIKGKQGEIVISQLQRRALQQFTSQLSATLVEVQATNQDVQQVVSATSHNLMMEASKEKQKLDGRQNNGYWFMLPILLCLLWGMRKGLLVATLAVMIFPKGADAANLLVNQDAQAYEQFSQNNYQQASEQFVDPAWRGIAQYRAGEYQKAVESLKQADDITSEYNLANSYAQLGEYPKAIEQYKKVLQQDPRHQDAKHNLEQVEKRLQQQKQKKNKQQQKQDQKQNQEQDNKQDQQSQDKQSDQQKQQQSQQSQDKQSDQQKQQQSQQSQDNQSDQQKQQQSQQSQDNQSDQQKQQQSQQSQDQQSDQQKQQQNQQSQDKQFEQHKKPQNQASQNENPEQTKGAKGDKKETSSEQASVGVSSSQVSEGDPVMKKLEQIPDDASQLIRAQIMLQQREKEQNRGVNSSW
ncbi:VWA domain-containing protein [Vibrio sp. SS-MA-C1-2]|uniref:vWA domain-containing protein n=1 Tax=Vibrio sp. SS-MA-C1-2 TaxID=2908646 RepID=UPI001F384907|nr:VWA domain-containing protein [Vibrio sp. SS-MA-C1-2]UJF18583.1 VWA domain-containing protein [Vibrio sp. SS-MA-C1-2]